MSAPSPVPNEARDARWDLTSLFPSDEEAIASSSQVVQDAADLNRGLRGRLNELTAPALAQAIDRYADIRERQAAARAYAALRVYQDRSDETARDLQGRIGTHEDEADRHLRFFVLEISRLDDETLRVLVGHEALRRHRHWISRQRDRGRHLLEPAAEDALAARSEAAEACWGELHQSVLGGLEIPVEMPDGVQVIGLSQAASLVKHPDRAVRRSLVAGLGAALEPVSDVLARCYDSRVADRVAVDQLRGHDSPMGATNLANDLPQDAVDALLEAVRSHYPIAQEWFAAKADHMGHERLDLCDLHAVLGDADIRVSWDEALELTAEAFTGFSEEAGRIARSLVCDGHVDAGPRPGKRLGAFTLPAGARSRPFIMLSFDGRMRQLSSLAHELGHGVHRTMSAREHDVLSYGSGTPIAEIPSTFFELLVRDRALARLEDPLARAALRCSYLEDTFAIVFRQTQMATFEEVAYRARFRGEHLSADRLNRIWMETSRDYLGDAVQLPEEARLGWSYVPHFIAASFYTYSYSFAHLCAQALHARWCEDPEPAAALISRALLSRGGAASPAQILDDLGLDIGEPGFWGQCFEGLRRDLATARADLAQLR